MNAQDVKTVTLVINSDQAKKKLDKLHNMPDMDVLDLRLLSSGRQPHQPRFSADPETVDVCNLSALKAKSRDNSLDVSALSLLDAEREGQRPNPVEVWELVFRHLRNRVS